MVDVLRVAVRESVLVVFAFSVFPAMVEPVR